MSILYISIGLPVIINRNPTIGYGSILHMYCVGIVDSYTMAVPLQILPLLAADLTKHRRGHRYRNIAV